MNIILETGRLRLRELTLDDAGFIIELLNSPGWLQFIGDRNVRTEEEAIHYLQEGPIKSYSQNGFGLYLVEGKDDKQAVGICGIIKRDGLDNPDIGFAFLEAFTGKGFAFEIAYATLKYATEELHLPKISAITVAGNVKSIRLLEKIGLKLAKNTCLPNSNEELLLYSN